MMEELILLLQPLFQKYNIYEYELLNKGWSSDIKLILKSKDFKYLLRISSIDKYEIKKKQFALLHRIDNLNIYCSKPIGFNKLNDNYCYMLLSWLEGIDGELAIKDMSNKEAYDLGIEAGEILNKLHSISIDIPKESWWDRYEPKSVKKINNFLNCGYQMPYQEKILKYYKDNLYLMKDRPLKFSHGDYHLGNLIVKDKKIGVIDFDKNTIADAYDDLKPFCWNVMRSEYFETGLINGYFNNNIPEDFFKILKFYTVESLISHLPWAIQFGQEKNKWSGGII